MNDTHNAASSTEEARTIIAPPTSTLIAVSEHSEHQVWVLRVDPEKHPGKTWGLVGGKLKLKDRQTARDCILTEFQEEAGGQGARLVNLRRMVIATYPYRDMRNVSLARATDKSGPAQDADHPVVACYGAVDTVWIATVLGTPAPKDGETKAYESLDVRKIHCAPTQADSLFCAGHDLFILGYYLRLLGVELDEDDYSDFENLRARIPGLIEKALRYPANRK